MYTLNNNFVVRHFTYNVGADCGAWWVWLVARVMESAVVYLGHIPHGFYEEEMNKYFSQFGTVTRLKLARSKKVCGCFSLVSPITSVINADRALQRVRVYRV